MAKRLSDSTKWADEWFTELPMDMKLVWLYILDMCDHSGVYKVNMKLLRFQTGTDRPENEIIDYLKDRIYIADGKWFIPKFINFQYKNFFTSNTPAIRSARELLISHNIIKPNDEALPNPSVTLRQPLANPSITLIEPLANPYETLKEPLDNPYIRAKDKDMDMDKDKAMDKNSDMDKNIAMDNSMDEYTYENEYRSKGSTKGITEKVLDILMNADSDDVLYKRAVDDWNDLGGIEEVAKIMEWGENEKINWKSKLDNIYAIKRM